MYFFFHWKSNAEILLENFGQKIYLCSVENFVPKFNHKIKILAKNIYVIMLCRKLCSNFGPNIFCCVENFGPKYMLLRWKSNTEILVKSENLRKKIEMLAKNWLGQKSIFRLNIRNRNFGPKIKMLGFQKIKMVYNRIFSWNTKFCLKSKIS